MSAPSVTGMQPNLFRIWRAAVTTPCEFVFATRAEATRVRHQLYAARRKFSRTGHPLAVSFEMVVISTPKERAAANGQGTEWFWRIGEDIVFEKLNEQLEKQLRAEGVDPSIYDPKPLETGEDIAAQLQRTGAPPPPLPEHTPAQTDAAIAGYVPPPRPIERRESTQDILDQMAATPAVKPEDPK